jgi:hypothetical protein
MRGFFARQELHSFGECTPATTAQNIQICSILRVSGIGLGTIQIGGSGSWDRGTATAVYHGA